MKKLTYGSAGDWAGIWIDGELRYQNHSIQIDWWLELLAEGPFEVDDQAEKEWCYADQGHFEDLVNP